MCVYGIQMVEFAKEIPRARNRTATPRRRTTAAVVVNMPCAHEGFEALWPHGYIQGISSGKDNSMFVHGCSGNGALVRFNDMVDSSRCVIFSKEGVPPQLLRTMPPDIHE